VYLWLTQRHINICPEIVVVSTDDVDRWQEESNTIVFRCGQLMNTMSQLQEKRWLVSNVTTLNFLQNNYCYMDDSVFTALLQLINGTQLTRLDVSGCANLTDIAMLEVTLHCPNLVHLNISNLRQLTRTSVDSIVHKLKNLTSINLERSVQVVIDSPVTDCIGFLFKNCQLTDVNIRHCGGVFLSTIQFIAMSAPNCDKMRSLVLNNSTMGLVDDTHINNLCGFCPLIEELTLDSLYCLTVRAFINIGRRLSRLTFLSFNGLNNADLIVQVLSEVFSSCSRVDLSAMRFNGRRRRSFQNASADLERQICQREARRDLDVLSHSLWLERSMNGFREPMLDCFGSYLVSISIGNWHEKSYLVEPTPGDLAAACHHLTELNIVQSNISDAGVEAFGLMSSGRLTTLRFERCQWVSDRGVFALVTSNNNSLAKVCIVSCHQSLSDYALGAVSSCIMLCEFQTFFQPNVTASGINLVKNSCKYLRKFNVFKFEGCTCDDRRNCLCYM
jgi:hypothetical protein